jgi:hypothetical protein
MRTAARVFVCVVMCALGMVSPALAQPGSSEGKVGVAVKASTLGIGFDGAAKVASKINIRAGVNFFNYSRDFENEEDNITYVGDLKLQSIHATVDFFPFGGGFHISPSLIIRNNNKATLSATIPGGQEIGIDDTDYKSSTTDPIKSSGLVTVEKTRPAIMVGWGNVIPSSRRWSVPFELGVIFQGAPAATLSFSGSACNLNGTNCRTIASDPTIQAKVAAQQNELNADLNKGYFKFYPIISLGVAFRF